MSRKSPRNSEHYGPGFVRSDVAGVQPRSKRTKAKPKPYYKGFGIKTLNVPSDGKMKMAPAFYMDGAERSAYLNARIRVPAQGD